jgi:Zn-dependent protease
MSRRELSHLAFSVMVLSIAFGIAFSGGMEAFNDIYTLLENIRVAFIAVFFGFVFHELAHRFVARKYGFSAEYFMSPVGLGIAVVASLTGWILAAPGAVRIYGGTSNNATAEEYRTMLGKISLAGPLTNLVIAFIFLLLGLGAAYFGYFPNDNSLFWTIVSFGVEINAWLAIFNMIPVWNLDGRDVFKWNKIMWVAVMLLSLGLYIYMIT